MVNVDMGPWRRGLFFGGKFQSMRRFPVGDSTEDSAYLTVKSTMACSLLYLNYSDEITPYFTLERRNAIFW